MATTKKAETTINETAADNIVLDDATKAAMDAYIEARVKAALEAKEKENRAKTSIATATHPVESKPAIDPYFEERVCVELLYDGVHYKDPVFLQINGENCVVERGKPVWIKRKFAELLEQSKISEYHAATYQKKQAQELEKIKELGA